MPQVPASVCRQGNRQVWKTYASNFIAVCIDSRDECGIGFTLNSWELGGAPKMSFRPIVQAESAQRLGWKPYSRYLGKGRSKRLRWDCSTIREAWVGTWRWRCPQSDPTVQIDQHSAQERCVVHGVERELPTYAICRAYCYGRKHANAVLGPSKVIATYDVRLRRFGHVYQICMDERSITTPVFRRGIRKHDLGHFPMRLQACQEGARLPCYWISLSRVSKREEFGHDVADILGGLTKAQIKLATHPTSDVGNDAVQRHAPSLVLV